MTFFPENPVVVIGTAAFVVVVFYLGAMIRANRQHKGNKHK